MKKIYHFIRFKDSIGRPAQDGNEQRLIDLISPLDKICVRLGGHKLESTDYYDLQRASMYIVETCWIKNDINLAAGTRTTDIGFFKGFGNEILINTFKSLYGEKNMYRSSVFHNVQG